jgi:hypothetical protein
VSERARALSIAGGTAILVTLLLALRDPGIKRRRRSFSASNERRLRVK